MVPYLDESVLQECADRSAQKGKKKKKKSKKSAQRKRTRRKLWDLANGICCWCSKKISMSDASIEHLLPKHFGICEGKPIKGISCRDCNARRANSLGPPDGQVNVDVLADYEKALRKVVSVATLMVSKSVAGLPWWQKQLDEANHWLKEFGLNKEVKLLPENPPKSHEID